MKEVVLNRDNYEGTDRTYGATEAALKLKGYKVLHLHRDVRGDWGDDGGFIWAVSYNKDGKFYAHVIQVNYNIPVPDFYPSCDNNEINKEFTYVGEAQKYLRDLESKLYNLEKEYEVSFDDFGGYYEPSEIRADFKTLKEEGDEFLNALIICSFPYGEYRDQNKRGLLDSFNNRYTENFVNGSDNEEDVDSPYFAEDYKFVI